MMNILKINASVGIQINVWIDQLEEIGKKILHGKFLFDDKFYENLYYSLSNEEKEIYHKEWNLRWDSEEDWKINREQYRHIGLQILLKFVERRLEYRQFEIHSEFNDCRLVFKGNYETKERTSSKQLKEQWADLNKKKEQEWQDYLASPEGVLYIENQEKARKAQEKAEKEYKNTLKKISFSFNLGGKSKWKTCLSKNKDPYGKATLDYAKYWAYLMEKNIRGGILTKEIKDKTAQTADVEGITGYMYGCAVSILSEVWLYGYQLKKLHNKEYGKDDEAGVVNPAVITVTV